MFFDELGFITVVYGSLFTWLRPACLANQTHTVKSSRPIESPISKAIAQPPARLRSGFQSTAITKINHTQEGCVQIIWLWPEITQDRTLVAAASSYSPV